MRVSDKSGSVIESHGKEFAVDSTYRHASAGFITHAHSDHIKILKTVDFPYYMSPLTKEILGEEYKGTKSLDKPLKFDETTVSLHSAGHIGGSSQVHFADGINLVVTGDMKMEDDLLVKGAEPLKCDTLVIESTFGRPEYVFPKRETVYEEMSAWCKANLDAGASVILAGYSVGKAQELNAFVNQYLGDVPIVHPKIAKVNEAYNNHGFKLDYLDSSTKEARDAGRDARIFLLPPHLVDLHTISAMSTSYDKRFVSAFATGWSVRGASGKYNKAFPLSSHAHFPDLVKYVEASGAKKVYTQYGYAREFAAFLRKKGVDARPLNESNQQSLADFCD